MHFKGSGFYNTDYGTSKRKREMDASAKSGADKHDAKSKDKKDSSSGSLNVLRRSSSPPQALRRLERRDFPRAGRGRR